MRLTQRAATGFWRAVGVLGAWLLDTAVRHQLQVPDDPARTARIAAGVRARMEGERQREGYRTAFDDAARLAASGRHTNGTGH